MKKRGAAIAAAIGGLAAALVPPSCLSAQPLSAADAAKIVTAAKANIRHKLKDPDSAQFRGLFISTRELETGGKTQTLHYLCGELNARNGHGGFAGFRRFAADSTAPGGHIDNPENEAAAYAFAEVIWKSACSNKVSDVR